MTKISVILPVYNAATTLRDAIESILNQTSKDFELLIIDDGSTDRSAEIAKSYNDPRIRFLTNSINLKLIKTLNLGIQKAQGQFIARMDADDISLPQRLERQVAFLESHPEYAACGTQAIKIDQAGQPQGKLRKPSKNLEAWAWIPTPMIHPTVMIRAEVAKANLYDESAVHCEDYEYWLRLGTHGLKTANLSEPLLMYRMHSSSVTAGNRHLQLDNSYEVFCRYFPRITLSKGEYWTIIGAANEDLSWSRRWALMEQISSGKPLPMGLLAFAAFKHLRGRFQSLIGS